MPGETFRLDVCTKDELLRRCRLKNIKQKDHQFLIDYFILRKSAIELAAESPQYTDQYFRNKAYRLKTRLES